MKRLHKLLLVFPAFLSFYFTATAQVNSNTGQRFYVGNSESLLRDLYPSAANARVADPAVVTLKVSSSTSFTAKVNVREATGGGQSIAGALQDVPGATFFVGINHNAVQGYIILPGARQAYKYSSDAQGNTFVTDVDINSVLCIDYVPGVQAASESKNRSSAPAAQLGAAVANLQSYPQGIACVYLDFDGHFYQGSMWAGGTAINALPSTLTDAQVQEAWELTSEDFSPFNINVTTSETVFNSYAVNKRQRCVITPTNDAAPGAGGVAYVDLFNGDVPCWVFTSTAKSVGEAISHEVGHTLGLTHDGRTTPVEDYYTGQGSWAPIMGVGYNKSIVQWSKGEYANANNTQDDFTIIVRPTKATGVKPDEHGNTTATATPLQVDAAGAISASLNFGIIGTATDVDMFSFSTAGGNAVLNFNPATRHGDLDILATLYNSAGGVVATANPTGLAAVINTTLTSGVYYISIDGTGAGDPVTTGYSDYASLGYFSISGTVVPPLVVNQAPTVSITAPASGSTYTAPATVSITANASDPDGSVARVEFFYGTTKIGEDVTSPFSISWTSVPAGSYSLTAKATDNQGKQAVSAAVSIQVNVNIAPTVSITAPLQNAIYTALPATIAIAANASDADGSVSKVEFFNGTTKLGEDVTSPFSFSWTGVGLGTYSLTAKATDNLGATASAAVHVIVDQNPLANAGPDSTLAVPRDSLALSGSGSAIDGSRVTFSWAQLSGPNDALFSNKSISTPIASNLQIGTYVFELTVMNINGLTSKDQVTITVQLPADIDMGTIPRFFSPNGDGNNDLWQWPNIEFYSQSKLTIFNQAGQQVYQANSYNNTWDGNLDGKPLADNAYYYVIQLSNDKKITGAVRIIR